EPNGDGTYTVTYSLTVTRTGDGPNYRLTDELRYGDAVTVVGQPTVTAPAGVTPNPDFDGTADTVIADDVAIADGESHVYTIDVVVAIDAGSVTFESSDCSLTGNEVGTGLPNTASLEVNGVTLDDEECPPQPGEP